MDILKFLKDYDIDFKPKSATSGWVQIQECPFCFNDRWHLGIHLQKTHFNCFICNESGKIEWLIKSLLKTSYNDAKKIAGEYSGATYYDSSETRSDVIDPGIISTLQPIHINYLIERGFDYVHLERRYRIGGNYTVGRFPYRIVIPVYDDGILVNATARDVTGLQQERYMSLRNEESVVPIKETVYNIDAVTGENILIVEGPFDAWRMGGPTVCLFGTAFKQQQVMRILSKFPKNIYICFDQETEAQKNANRLAACFAPFVSHVEVIEIPVKDPALLSPEQALEIRNELQL